MQEIMASTESRKQNWKDLDITPDEVERLSNALKNEEFRKLFVEYAEEISDPDNRRRYEAEIAQMEAERGMDISFVHPEPGYVLKTAVGDHKAFINICSNEHIEKPRSSTMVGAGGKKGMQWSIPHSFSPVRDDLDKQSKKCKVYDIVFHHDTLRMAQVNERFKKMINDTALDGIARTYDVTVDKKNVKLLNMKFKGTPQATIIRKKKQESEMSEGTETTDSKAENDRLKFPYPYDLETTEERSKKKEEEIMKREQEKARQAKRKELEKEHGKESDSEAATIPKYTIVHRSDLDLQEFTDAPDARKSTRPKELVVTIHLPLLKSAASVDLDILENKLSLVSTTPAAYKLDVNLPYPVNDDNGTAKFDKHNRKLTVTLPVIPDKQKGLMLDLAPAEDETAKPEGLPDLIPLSENPDAKPLIEVLSSDDGIPAQQSIDSGDLPDSSGDGDDSRDEKCIWSGEDVGDEKFVPKISYSFPSSYDVNQDDKTVSCVIEVKKVTLDSVSKSFSADKRTVTVKFISMGAGGFPTHYSYCIKFPEGCNIVPEQTSVDVAEGNVVLLMLKERSCRQVWKNFEVGLDENHLEEKLFTTEESLGECLDLLAAEASQTAKTDAAPPAFKVADLNEEKLVIEVGGSPYLSDSDTDQSPREIEVVHQKETPNIPSILKQRTLSESSDELSSSWNGRMGSEPAYSRESSRQDSWSASETENSDGKLRKSVKFNDHIDMTTFRSTQAVTTMKTALKSKRRRQRKKEQKQGRRRRTSSTGSEYSSSDDTGAGAPPRGKKGNLGTHVEANDSSAAQKEVDRTSNAEMDVTCDISDDKLRTRVKQDGDEGMDSVEQNPGEVEGEDDFNEGEDSVQQNWEELDDTAKQDDNLTEKYKDKIKVTSREAASDDEDDVDERTNDVGPQADNAMSWDDKPPTGVDPMQSEHKTKCAFDFSNSVIYDLDID